MKPLPITLKAQGGEEGKFCSWGGPRPALERRAASWQGSGYWRMVGTQARRYTGHGALGAEGNGW